MCCLKANFRNNSDATAIVLLSHVMPAFQMCKRYPGFVRVALQDPQPERRFFRRAWVTFERDVNIKEICWNLNNIRVIHYTL